MAGRLAVGITSTAAHIIGTRIGRIVGRLSFGRLV